MAGKAAGTPRSDSTRPEVEGLPAAKSGPPGWEPTAEQLEQLRTMAARGVGEREMAAILAVDRKTIRDNEAAKAAIEAGRAVGITTLTGVLFKHAQNGSLGHLKMYLSHVAEWRGERSTHEHTGPGGGALAFTILTGVPQPEAEKPNEPGQPAIEF